MKALKNACMVIFSSIIIVALIVSFWNPIMWFLSALWAIVVLFFTTIGLLFLFLIPAILFVIWYIRQSAEVRKYGRGMANIIGLVLVVHALWSTRGHLIERSRMEPLRQTFISTAQGGGTIINTVPHYGGGELDYGGSLKSLTDKRNSSCQQDGFLFLGSWTVLQSTEDSTPKVTTWGLYVWMPFVSLR